MNSITITGNLGKDSEMKILPDGTQILSFSVADSQGRDKSSIWWNCTLFGKRAESLQAYLNKGQTVTVIGSVSEREWADKDGSKRKSMDIRVNDIALQGGKPAQPQEQVRAKLGQAIAPASKPAPSSGFDDMESSDIPFISSAFACDTATSKARRMARYDY
jgi:single-strand DNA-binding protein